MRLRARLRPAGKGVGTGAGLYIADSRNGTLGIVDLLNSANATPQVSGISQVLVIALPAAR